MHTLTCAPADLVDCWEQTITADDYQHIFQRHFLRMEGESVCVCVCVCNRDRRSVHLPAESTSTCAAGTWRASARARPPPRWASTPPSACSISAPRGSSPPPPGSSHAEHFGNIVRDAINGHRHPHTHHPRAHIHTLGGTRTQTHTHRHTYRHIHTDIHTHRHSLTPLEDISCR